MDLNRQELQEIREAALEGELTCENELWKRAYRDLQDVADRLDAMRARCEGPVQDEDHLI